MNILFENKRVLVTGAGKGIGKELVKAFVQGKAEKVFALSKTKSNLDKLKSELPMIEIVNVDLQDWNATRKAVESLGTIDILVNNAGMTILEPFLEVKPDTFDSLFTVNVKSIINVSQVVAKGMIAKKGGSIVNVSSQASKIALKDHTVYGATKAAVDAITKQMAVELGQYNIRVNAVNPTVIMTDMGRHAWSDPKKAQPLLDRIPLRRFGEIEDVVHAVLYLSSDKSNMINAVTLPIEGGILAS